VGALLLGATVAAPKVDGFIASSQRRSIPSSHFSVCVFFHFFLSPKPVLLFRRILI
jgi:hypothetical protein